jgi:hypothetical protein
MSGRIAGSVSPCNSCSGGFDGVHCRRHAPVVVGKQPSEAEQRRGGGVVWCGFPLLPSDRMGCGDWESK